MEDRFYTRAYIILALTARQFSNFPVTFQHFRTGWKDDPVQHTLVRHPARSFCRCYSCQPVVLHGPIAKWKGP